MPPAKFIKWLFTLALLSSIVGSISAFFLWSLDKVTELRLDQSWLVFLLPIFGIASGFYYRYNGKSVNSANQVILAAAHKPETQRIPARLAPSILFATIGTHLFGGSSGREGAAVQMGAGIASALEKYIPQSRDGSQLLMLCGISAGFGAVFGTPLAAGVFALEFIRRRIVSPKIIPCLVAAFAAHYVCLAWGSQHTLYPKINLPNSFISWFLLTWKLIILSVLIAFGARLFISLSHFASKVFLKHFPHEAIRAFAGGLVIISLFLLVGHSDYLGLGVLAEFHRSLTIPNFFSSSVEAPATAWLWKMIFTIITIAAGFKGGEVTPLFFIGAALGNSLAWMIGAPIELFAGIGMIAIFAAATNTPVASVIMGTELLGWNIAFPLTLCAIIAWKLSGPKSIYPNIKDL